MSSQRRHCIPQETVIRHVQLAAAYVPFQRLCCIMCPIESLVKGTVFPELYSPYSKKEYVEQEMCDTTCNIKGGCCND